MTETSTTGALPSCTFGGKASPNGNLYPLRLPATGAPAEEYPEQDEFPALWGCLIRHYALPTRTTLDLDLCRLLLQALETHQRILYFVSVLGNSLLKSVQPFPLLGG